MSALKDKKVHVTGAAQGIGRSIVEKLLEQGASVLATDIHLEPLSGIAADSRLCVSKLDVTDSEHVQACAHDHPDVDVLINCAGFVSDGDILNCDASQLQRCFSINVESMFNTISAHLPKMLERQSGSIINIASVVSTVKAAPNRFAYATSKGAVIALTKSVAMDYIGQGIRCNAISPGTVASPSLDQRIASQPNAEEARRNFIARQPMGRLAKTSEIATVALMLASDDAAFMTGENIVIDGGFSL